MIIAGGYIEVDADC